MVAESSGEHCQAYHSNFYKSNWN